MALQRIVRLLGLDDEAGCCIAIDEAYPTRVGGLRDDSAAIGHGDRVAVLVIQRTRRREAEESRAV